MLFGPGKGPICGKMMFVSTRRKSQAFTPLAWLMKKSNMPSSVSMHVAEYEWPESKGQW